MFRKTVYLMILVLNILSATVPAQDGQGNVSLNYSKFIPKWSKGDSWSLEVSCLGLEKHIPTRDYYGRARMTVVQTPVDGFGNYVISIVPDDERLTKHGQGKMFITLDQNDLSLLEIKSISTTDPNDVSIRKYPGHKIQKIHMGMLGLVFPVLSASDDQNHKNIHCNPERGSCTKAGITIFEGEDALVLHGVSRDWEKEDFLRRLNEGAYDYRLLWKKGNPWWTSQTSLQEVRYRVELLRTDSELMDANSVEEKFTILYNRYKAAKDQGKVIESDEIYYDIVLLGRQAVPYIIDRIKAGDRNLITALSEITGLVPRNATIIQCLEWWAKKNKEN